MSSRIPVACPKPVVYSVGTDLIDQGGKVDWNHGQQPGDFILTIPE